MSGLEGASIGWTGFLASVLALIVWAALIGGLSLIVRGRMQAEGKAQSEIVRRVEAELSCRGCGCMDPQLVHWLPEDREERGKALGCVLASDPAAGHAWERM